MTSFNAPSLHPNALQPKVLLALSLCGLLAAMWLKPAQARELGGQPQTDLPRTVLQAGMHKIDAQVASTPAQRATGLMWRLGMPTHEGMLFVFEQAAVQCFWMKNTPSPLTAAFVADDGTIVNLADMQPMTEDSHCSRKPVRYVLEMNQGWFKQKGIAEGTQLRGKPFSQ